LPRPIARLGRGGLGHGKTHVSPTCDLDVHDRVGGGRRLASGFIYGTALRRISRRSPQARLGHGALLTTTPGDTTMVTLEQVKAFAKGARRAFNAS